MQRSDILQAVYEYADSNLNKTQFMRGKSPVPASGPLFYPEDIQELVDAALDFWYTDWKRCKAFREALCEYTGKKHCVLTNSGSSASLIAMTALAQQTTKRFVVTTAVGFPTTVYPIYQKNKIPIFVDIDPHTLSPDWDQVLNVSKKYENDIAGYIFAHTLGLPFDETNIISDDAFIISDCCDALGSKYSAHVDSLGGFIPVGTHADAMTLSFFPAHHITSLDYSELVFVQDFYGYIYLKKIGEFADLYKNNVGWKCVSFDKNGNLDFSEITGIVKHPVSEPLYRIKLQTGREVVVSKSHNLFTRSPNNNIISKMTSELRVGDFIFAPNKLPNYENIKSIPYIEYRKGSWKAQDVILPISWELGRILGYFVAEGSYNKTSRGNYGIVFSFGSSHDEIEYVDEVIYHLSSIFGIQAHKYSTENNGTAIRCSNKGLYKFLSYWCGVGAENKKIPEFIYSAPTEVKQAFLDAYYAGDGCEHKTYGKHKGFSKDCVTVSSDLAKGLVYLLLQLGISSRYSVRSQTEKRDFGKYISSTLPSYNVCFSNKSILNSAGFRGQHGKRNRQFGDLSLVKILSIEEVQSTTDFVYDLSVIGKENFVAGIGCVVHNTGEGGAVLTNDDALASRLECLASWGRDCYCLPGQSNTCGYRFKPQHFGYDKLPEGWDHKYTFTQVGYNLKMTELQAALGLAQLKHIDEFVFMRQANFNYLWEEIYDPKNLIQPTAEWGSPFGLPIIVKKSARFTAIELIEYLERHKIATRRIFGGNLTRQPVFEHLPYVKMDLTQSDFLMENGFWIGVHPALTEEHLRYVVDVFNDFYDERGL